MRSLFFLESRSPSGVYMENTWIVAAVAGVVAVFLIARWSHIRRLRAEVRRTTPVPPEGVLSWSLAEWPVAAPGQENRAKGGTPRASSSDAAIDGPVGIVVASADALLWSLPSLRDLASIDWDVIDGIHLSAAPDLSHWADLKGYLSEHFFEVEQPDGFLNRLIGYFYCV